MYQGFVKARPHCPQRVPVHSYTCILAMSNVFKVQCLDKIIRQIVHLTFFIFYIIYVIFPMKLDILVENNKFYDSLHNLCFFGLRTIWIHKSTTV